LSQFYVYLCLRKLAKHNFFYHVHKRKSFIILSKAPEEICYWLKCTFKTIKHDTVEFFPLALKKRLSNKTRTGNYSRWQRQVFIRNYCNRRKVTAI
jgi:hypothetical protein